MRVAAKDPLISAFLDAAPLPLRLLTCESPTTSRGLLHLHVNLHSPCLTMAKLAIFGRWARSQVEDSKGKKRRLRVASKKQKVANPLKTLVFLPDTKADYETPAESLAKLEADLEKTTGKKPKGLPASMKNMAKAHIKKKELIENGAPAHAHNKNKRQKEMKHGGK